MSKRFGRNQKRRMREALQQANDRIDNLEAAGGLQDKLVAYMRAQLSELRDAIAVAEEMLTPYSAALPPKTVEVHSLNGREVRLAAAPPMLTAVSCGAPAFEPPDARRLHILTASLHKDARRMGEHVLVSFDNMEWGYALEWRAIASTPHNILVRRISESLAILISRQLKERAGNAGRKP